MNSGRGTGVHDKFFRVRDEPGMAGCGVYMSKHPQKDMLVRVT